MDVSESREKSKSRRGGKKKRGREKRDRGAPDKSLSDPESKVKQEKACSPEGFGDSLN